MVDPEKPDRTNKPLRVALGDLVVFGTGETYHNHFLYEWAGKASPQSWDFLAQRNFEAFDFVQAANMAEEVMIVAHLPTVSRLLSMHRVDKPGSVLCGVRRIAFGGA